LLLELKVRDIGIIGRVDWSLGCGLNVITGETGAGKSLVIGSVEALLAGKADAELVRHGADKAQIEGVFEVPDDDSYSQLRALLEEKGIGGDDGTLVISCQPRRQGRSIVRVNGHAVPRAVVGQIGRFLVDIHGQSEHLSLRHKEYHLGLLDAYAHLLEERRCFRDKVAELSALEKELKALIEEEAELARREELLRFQLDEIKRAEVREGEESELEKGRNILASAEKLKAFSYEAYQSLSGEDSSGASSSTVDRLSEALQTMKKLAELDPSLKKQAAFLEETLYGLEEAARDIRSYSERMEYDPNRLEEIESRLELIKTLKRKYGGTIAEVLAHMSQTEKELETLSTSTERRAQLEESRSCLKEEMGKMASGISQARSAAAQKLIAEVKKELKDLNMSQVEFGVSIAQSRDEDGIPFPDGDSYAFTADGADIVEFIASTNPGEPPKPLTKIASTGEISRFTLALKGALSEADRVPVLIFDEIDIGVGGRSGEVIGRKLWALARRHQVICVTHLPQIAAFADAHYGIHKEVVGERTLSMLETLDDDSRIGEIAAMLGGRQYGETSLQSARELIAKAESWKKSHRE